MNLRNSCYNILSVTSLLLQAQTTKSADSPTRFEHYLVRRRMMMQMESYNSGAPTPPSAPKPSQQIPKTAAEQAAQKAVEVATQQKIYSVYFAVQ